MHEKKLLILISREQCRQKRLWQELLLTYSYVFIADILRNESKSVSLGYKIFFYFFLVVEKLNDHLKILKIRNITVFENLNFK